MADYDVEAIGLGSPPNPAPLTTYTPAIQVRNNGIHAAIAAGTISAYIAGVKVFSSNVLSEQIDAGDIGLAVAADDWTPTDMGPITFYGYVTTDKDQVERNNNLPPVTVMVIEPPPPPEPATLDDVVERLETLGTEETLEQVKDKLPPEPSTEPTLEEVRDKLPTSPATEASQLAIISQLQQLALEGTLLDTLAKLGAGLPDNLGPNGGLKIDPEVAIPAALASPYSFAANGLKIIGVVKSELWPEPRWHSRAIFIQASIENTVPIYIGDASVSTSGAHCICRLEPGDSFAMEFDLIAVPVYAVASQAAQSIYFGATEQIYLWP
jgi:hypothetical protein